MVIDRPPALPFISTWKLIARISTIAIVALAIAGRSASAPWLQRFWHIVLVQRFSFLKTSEDRVFAPSSSRGGQALSEDRLVSRRQHGGILVAHSCWRSSGCVLLPSVERKNAVLLCLV